MNRKEEIVKIKEQINIFDLIKQFGIKWWNAGTGKIKIKSLINNDSDPSCIIYTDKNDFYDFSAQRGGSVIDFYMYATNKSYTESIKDLRSILNNNGVSNLKIKPKLNDYADCQRKFKEILDIIMPIRKKTKYLKKISIKLDEIKNEILHEIFSNDTETENNEIITDDFEI